MGPVRNARPEQDRRDRRGGVVLVAAVAALGPACGGEPEPAVIVTIAARPATLTEQIGDLEVTVGNGGASKSQRFAVDGQAFPLTFSVTTGDRTGALDVSVRAFDADGNTLGVGQTQADLTVDELAMVLDPADFVVNTEYAGSQRTGFDYDVAGYQLAGGRDRATFGLRDNCMVAVCPLVGRRFDDHGRPLDTELGAGTGQFRWTAGTGADTGSELALAGLGDGGTIAAWDGAGGEVVCRSLPASGTGASAERTLITELNADLVTANALATGNVVLTWVARTATSTYELKATVVNPQCGTVTAPFVLAAPVDAFPRAGIAAGDQGVLFTWTDGPDLRYRLGTANGTVSGGVTTGTLLLAGSASETMEYARPVALDDGYAVVYRANTVGGDSHPIRLRRVNSTGGVVGVDAVVGTFANAVGAHAVARRSDGAIAVAWETATPSDGGGTGIAFRVLRPTGLPVGDIMLVNSTRNGEQTDAQVAAIEGAFVIGFTDDSRQAPDSDDTSVRGRFVYPAYDEARGVLGANCLRNGFPDCDAGGVCVADASGTPRCHAACDFAGSPPQCPGGGVCTQMGDSAACILGG